MIVPCVVSNEKGHKFNIHTFNNINSTLVSANSKDHTSFFLYLHWIEDATSYALALALEVDLI